MPSAPIDVLAPFCVSQTCQEYRVITGIKSTIVLVGVFRAGCSFDDCNRPLSRRLDRCDRVIHNESGDPNGGNMCSFSGATCTSRVRHNADYVPYANIRFYVRESPASLSIAMAISR